MPNTIPLDARICTLLDDEIGEWKLDLVNHIFLPEDADAILSIPRSCSHAKDRLIWVYHPKGTFTLNSAYKLALSLSSQAHKGRASNDQDQRLFWNTIWSLNISNKIKTFTWRACRNILPTKVNL